MISPETVVLPNKEGTYSLKAFWARIYAVCRDVMLDRQWRRGVSHSHTGWKSAVSLARDY